PTGGPAPRGRPKGVRGGARRRRKSARRAAWQRSRGPGPTPRRNRSAALGGWTGRSSVSLPGSTVSNQLGGHDGVQVEDRFGHIRVAVVVRGATPDNQKAPVLMELEIIIGPEFPGFWNSGDVDVQGRIKIVRVTQEHQLLLDLVHERRG